MHVGLWWRDTDFGAPLLSLLLHLESRCEVRFRGARGDAVHLQAPAGLTLGRGLGEALSGS